MLAPRLFLPFHDEADIHRQISFYLESGLQGVQVHEDARLVVSHPTAVEPTLTERRFEGGTLPVRNSARRLDIVVAVEKNGGTSRRLEPFSVNIGMAAGNFKDLHPLEARLFHLFGRPRGRVFQGLGGKTLEADAGDFGIVDELLKEAVEVGV